MEILVPVQAAMNDTAASRRLLGPKLLELPFNPIDNGAPLRKGRLLFLLRRH